MGNSSEDGIGMATSAFTSSSAITLPGVRVVFRVWGWGFGVWGLELGFGVQGLGLRVQGL